MQGLSFQLALRFPLRRERQPVVHERADIDQEDKRRNEEKLR